MDLSRTLHLKDLFLQSKDYFYLFKHKNFILGYRKIRRLRLGLVN